jgi:hypothetical protein
MPSTRRIATAHVDSCVASYVLVYVCLEAARPAELQRAATFGTNAAQNWLGYSSIRRGQRYIAPMYSGSRHCVAYPVGTVATFCRWSQGAQRPRPAKPPEGAGKKYLESAGTTLSHEQIE